MQVHLSDWLVKHELIPRSLGFDCRGIETLQIETEDWDSIAVISYVYGYNYLRSQCAHDVAPGGFLASVYHFTKIRYDIDKPEEVCIKVFAPRSILKPRQFSGFGEVLIFRNGNLMKSKEYLSRSV
uniref:NADH-quinone oxidoreductase subunit C n=1 Tax=Pabstiella mirabilis TaxID=125501 RepID=A0A8F9RR53_9ASPA|nr:NADH-quinone oxidoreductase subunit C [Pabstiella mirabilis]